MACCAGADVDGWPRVDGRTTTMAETLLESSAISAFCGSMASMLSAGIQMDEAVHMLSDNQSDSRFRSVCGALYATLVEGRDYTVIFFISNWNQILILDV